MKIYFNILLFFIAVSATQAENLRGFHQTLNGIGTENIINDIKAKAAMGANITRTQLWTGIGDWKYSVEKQTQYYQSVNDWAGIVHQLRPTFKELNMKYILDFHDKACGKYFDKNPKCREIQMNAIVTKVREFKDDPLCWGVDLNEPKFKGRKGFYQELINKVNEIAPNMKILVEPYGGNVDYVDELDGLTGRNIVPSWHDYDPGEITHYGLSQWGIKDIRNKKYQYGGKKFNSKTRRKRLQRGRNFQLKHPQYDKPFIGESGITRVSVDPDNNSNVLFWLSDAFDLYNEWGWDVTYLNYKDRSNEDMWDVLFKGKKQKDHNSFPRNDVFAVFEKLFN